MRLSLYADSNKTDKGRLGGFTQPTVIITVTIYRIARHWALF